MHLNFLFMLIFLVLAQFIVLTPLRMLNKSFLDIFSISLGFLLITSSIAYYVVNLTLISIELLYAIIVALTLEYFCFFTFIRLKGSAQEDFIKYSKSENISRSEFISLLIFTTLLIIIFSQFYPITELMKFGDVDDFINVTNDLSTHEQKLMQFTYTEESTGVVTTGNFYPTAGFILGASTSELFSADVALATIYSLLFFAFFGYFFLVLRITKILRVQHPVAVLVFALSTNAFPISLIFSGNYSLIYGIIAMIACFVLFLELKDFINNNQNVIFHLTVFYLLIPLHPSVIFSYIILIYTYILLFEEKYKMLQILFISIASFSVSLIPFFYYFSRLNNNLLDNISALMSSLPSRIDYLGFIQEGELIQKIVSYYWKNVITLSAWNIGFPIFLILLFLGIIIAHDNAFKPKYLTPFFIYFALISISSISGISEFFETLTILTSIYYQSPIRITHIGSLIYLLYFVKFFTVFKKVT